MTDVHSIVVTLEKKCKPKQPDEVDDSTIQRYIMWRTRLYDVAYHVMLGELTINEAIAEIKPTGNQLT